MDRDAQTSANEEMARIRREAQEKGKGLGHALGEKGAGSGEEQAGGGGAGAGVEGSGYTHGEPSDEDLRAYSEMYRGETDGGTYMLGLVLMLIMAFGLGLIVGIIIGRAVYGI